MQHDATTPAIESSRYRWLRVLSKILCVSTFLLIFAGALVKSNNAGLSVPDWPTTFGQNMYAYPLSQMKGGVVYEHSHRLLASVIGLLTLIVTLWLPIVEKRDWMRLLGFISLSLVILQGLLGGLTVRMGLPDWVSILHGILAQTFFVVTILLAYGLSKERENRVASEIGSPVGVRVGNRAACAVGVVFLQLFLGALMRHKEAGLAIPDFPMMGHTWFPTFDAAWLAGVNATLQAIHAAPVTMGMVYTHLAHRFGALLVILAIVMLHVSIKPHRTELRKASLTLRLLDVALTIQLVLAAFTIWTHKSPIVTSLHVAVGALMLGLTVVLAVRAYPVNKLTATDGASSAPSRPFRETMALFLQMTKPRIVQMVLVTTTIGYFLAGHQIESWRLLLITLIGTGLSAAGSAVLNNYLERDVDARMPRTQKRVLPMGLVEPAAALAFGVTLVLVGVAITAVAVNILTALLVLLTAFLYVLVYTPLKRITWWNTSIGAIPGALPPMIGWAAVDNSLGAGAWILFFILFAWQHPHFYSIAWLYREDYRLGGFQMLSVVDPTGQRCFRHALWFTVALVAVSLLLTAYNLTGPVYCLGAILLGAYMLASCLGLSNTKTDKDARKVLISSVIYLPLLLLFIMLDAGFTALPILWPHAQ